MEKTQKIRTMLLSSRHITNFAAQLLAQYWLVTMLLTSMLNTNYAAQSMLNTDNAAQL